MDIEEKKRLFRITLGQNIKTYRELKGLSKTELAKLLSQKVGKDIAVSSCTTWEQGEYAPELPILGDLSEILDVRMDELVGYEKEKDSRRNVVIKRPFQAHVLKDTQPTQFLKVANLKNELYRDICNGCARVDMDIEELKPEDSKNVVEVTVRPSIRMFSR